MLRENNIRSKKSGDFRALQALVVSLFLDKFKNLPGIAMALKLTVNHDMPFIHIKVIKNIPGVGDDKTTVLPVYKPLVLLKQPGDGLSHEMNIFKVNSALRFIKHDKMGILDHHL